jgi:hypothetical protein
VRAAGVEDAACQPAERIAGIIRGATVIRRL